MFVYQTAFAEEQAIIDSLEVDGLADFARTHEFDFIGQFRRILSGEISIPEELANLLKTGAEAVFQDLKGVSVSLIVPMIAILFTRLVIPKKSSAQRTAAFVCRAGCITTLASLYVRMSATASEWMNLVLSCSKTAAPVMIASVAIVGAETTSAYLTPMTSVMADLIQNILCVWGFALSAAVAVVAVGGNLSDSISLERLQGLFRKILHWMAGVVTSGFLGLLSLQGRLGSGRDSVAARTARYAVENLIPVIGGSVSDSLDSLAATAGNIKNALGATGLVLLIHICAVPAVRIAGSMLVLRFISAVAEPLGDKGMTAMTGQFADAVEMLLITATVAAVLCGLLIGSCMAATGNLVHLEGA